MVPSGRKSPDKSGPGARRTVKNGTGEKKKGKVGTEKINKRGRRDVNSGLNGKVGSEKRTPKKSGTDKLSKLIVQQQFSTEQVQTL